MEVEVIYSFNKDNWRKGYATEAERAGLSFDRDVVSNAGNARKLYSIEE